jgi:hypothetical protein
VAGLLLFCWGNGRLPLRLLEPDRRADRDLAQGFAGCAEERRQPKTQVCMRTEPGAPSAFSGYADYTRVSSHRWHGESIKNIFSGPPAAPAGLGSWARIAVPTSRGVSTNRFRRC